MDPNNTSLPTPNQPLGSPPGVGQFGAPVMPTPGSGGNGSPIVSPAPAATPPVTTLPAYLPPTTPVQPAASQSQPGPQGAPAAPQAIHATPEVADDGDLIEKEWVMKAKAVVEQTKNDPHKQTKALHALKADYMKKRYNKVIEPVEE